MPITLSNLKPSPGSRQRSKRVGRGNASRGNYSGRGMKGQRARSGGRRGLKRAGMKFILQRIPKRRGFTSPHKKPLIINLGDLERYFENGNLITPAKLAKINIIQHPRDGVKILGQGEITKSFVFRNCLVSKSARDKIEKAGGKVEEITN